MNTNLENHILAVADAYELILEFEGTELEEWAIAHAEAVVRS